jgi:hypothetical protein
MRLLRLAGLVAIPLFGLAADASRLHFNRLVARQGAQDEQPIRYTFLGPKDEAVIGKGDRFNGGHIFPLGAGTSTPSKNASRPMFETILNHKEVVSAMLGLRAEYGINLIHPPHRSAEGRSPVIGMIPCSDGRDARKAGSCGSDDSYNVLFTANMLGHDRSSSDAIIYFVSDLLVSTQSLA